AHDEVADGLRAIAMPCLDDGIEDRERATPECAELGHRPTILLERLRQQVAALAAVAAEPLRIIEALGDHLVQYAGVLPHIECRQMEAEGLDPSQQPLDVEQSRVGAFVGAQAEGDERNVLTELVRILVTVRTPLTRAAQALADLCQ